MPSDVVFVVNPASGNGRTKRRWPRYRRAIESVLHDPFDVHLTDRPGRATELTRDALRTGATAVVCVGGDGTLNEVVNGYLDGSGRPWNAEARIAVLSVGTGSDFVRTIGLLTDPADIARRILDGRTRTIDAGRCDFETSARPASRFFVNVAEFGSGGAVVERVNRTTKVLGGRLSFLLAILRTMPSYRNTRVAYESDGEARGEAVMNDFIVANGRFFGGGLQPAPRADPSDGLFDVVIVGDVDFKTVRRNLPALRRGEHLELPQIRHFRCRSLTVRAGEEMIDLDGEYVGRGPTRFEILPGAVRLVV